jgi:LytS/YehU family sensor histidine kinase
MPVVLVTVYFYFIGISFLFILLQVAVYEGIYSIEEWYKATLEAKELKKLNLQMQFDSLKVQIQPHFLFNTLNTLVGLIDIDKIRAVKFTRQLAFVYRYLLNAHDRPLIDLEEELKFAQAYFYLLKTRYSEGLFLDIACDKKPDKFMVPPLSLQILLENAVKHNIITRSKPLSIQVNIDSQNKQLTVTNNLQQKKEVTSNGMGLAHLKKKFKLLNLKDIVVSANFLLFTVIVPIVEIAEEDK